MQNIKEQISNSVNATIEGEISGLEVMGNLKDLSKYIKACIEQIEPIADREFDRECEGAKSIKNFKGFTIERRSGGWNWDFSGVEDHEKLTSKKKDLDIKIKSLEMELKGIFEHANGINTFTGEVLDISRKPRKDSFIFKKKSENHGK
jgi:ribosomal protein L19